MRVFERGGKVNFVDDNNVLVGFDNVQDCCEDFEWFVATNCPANDVEADLVGRLTAVNYPGYTFDTDFEYSPYDAIKNVDEDRSMVAFRLTAPDLNDIYVVLMNSHNGYYSHGYDMRVNGEIKTSGSL